ncbi:MAG: outer membrane beta-barrel protein [Campylobacterota bacterium]|nr:outer membrane beta-barrel protein [Campylobacterota bacterium]
MKKLLVLALCAGLSTSLLAFQQEGVAEGNKKVSVYGELSNQDKSSMLYIGGSAGYYINNYIEVGGGLYGYINTYDGDTSEAITLSPYAQYNFSDYAPTIIPYVGVGLTYSMYEYGGETDSQLGFSLEAGGKFFTAPKTSFTPALFYQTNDYGDTLGVRIALEIYFD